MAQGDEIHKNFYSWAGIINKYRKLIKMYCLNLDVIQELANIKLKTLLQNPNTHNRKAKKYLSAFTDEANKNLL
jgi:predicted transcriptional regulator YheO